MALDTLAQTFKFESNYTFTSMDLYFKTKGTTPVYLSIGWTVNGYPSYNSFYSQRITAADINISTTGTVVTNVLFEMPIYVPENSGFFVSLSSGDRDYDVFISELGESDLITEEIVVTNSYLEGTLFLSSNGEAWDILSTKDLTCKLYAGTYELEGEIETENALGTDISAICIQLDETFPSSTSIEYYYSLDNGVTYKVTTPDEFNRLSTLSSNLKLKFKLNGNGEATPTIDLDSLNLITKKYDVLDDNYYKTKAVEGIPTYDNIKTIFDAHYPSGCAASFWGSIDSGVLYFPLDDVSPSTYISGDELTNYIYETDITDFSTLDGTLSSENYTVGELFVNGGNSFKVWNHNTGAFIISDVTGTIAGATTFTGATSGETVITDATTGETAYTTATTFVAKIHMTNTTAMFSPVIQKLKFVMKDV